MFTWLGCSCSLWHCHALFCSLWALLFSAGGEGCHVPLSQRYIVPCVPVHLTYSLHCSVQLCPRLYNLPLGLVI